MSAESRNPTAADADDALMTRVQRADPHAFRELFARHYDAALRYATVLAGNREDARDHVQEAFVRVYRGSGQYQMQGRFRGWLFTIIRNLVLDRAKRRTVRTTGAPAALARAENRPAPAPDRDAGNSLDRLAGLDEEQREIIVLRVVEEMSYAELASITGLREDHLRQIVSRALAKLRTKGASQ
ncbi:MAG TPA: sigma-70 family RNA polymerase sigma factor [Candidatus Ozemobacteraceae bacterium]|nr:sigma-70 family RNA polymerase sigma factor [Candidatus Ozemobacteraceae bacterium]